MGPEALEGSAEHGRSKERHRRIALSAASAVVARGVNVLTVLVSVPLTITYLGQERYGLWMTLATIQSLLGFADFGMGNGLVNAVAEAHGKDDEPTARAAIASAFWLLSGVGTLLLVGFGAVYAWLPWDFLFGIETEDAIAEAGPAAAIFVLSVALNLPLGVVERVRSGYQEGHLSSLWLAAGSLLGLGGVLLGITLRAGLPWLVLATVSGPILANLCNGVALFGVRRRALLPRLRHADRTVLVRLLRLGALFLMLQAAAAFAWGFDPLILAHVLGQGAVAEYATTRQLFSAVAVMVGLVLTPLWPAYGEAVARRDVEWIRRTLLRSLLVTFAVSAFACALLVGFGDVVVEHWLNGAIRPPRLLLVALALVTTFGQTGFALSMFLNGIGEIRVQALLAVAMAAVNLPLSILLTERLGISGVAFGTLIAGAVFTWLPLALLLPRILSRLAQRPPEPGGA